VLGLRFYFVDFVLLQCVTVLEVFVSDGTAAPCLEVGHRPVRFNVVRWGRY
jgi:hypothetical protein